MTGANQVERGASSSARFSLIYWTVVVTGGAVSLFAVELQEESLGQVTFIGLTLALYGYLAFEVWRALREESQRPWLQPAVLASVFHFGLAYLIGNTSFFDAVGFDTVPFGLKFVHKETYGALNTGLFAVMLGAFAMWRGYRSNWSRSLGDRVQEFLVRRKVLRQHDEINFLTIGLLLFLSVGALLLTVDQGVFGYSSDAARLAETQASRGWLNLGASAGKLVLLVLAMALLTRRYQHHRGLKVLFLSVLVWQVGIGLLSGFKSQVVVPVIVVAVAYYALRGRVHVKAVVLAVVLFFVAFRVVESFRTERFAAREFDGTSLASITTTMADAAIEGPRRRHMGRSESGWRSVVGRMAILIFTSEAIAFHDTFGRVPGSPDFMGSIVLAPVNAFIPRVIWSTKMVANDGHWFNVTVLGAPAKTTTSVGMGTVGYLNFAGGFWMIFLGYGLLGVIQRVTWQTRRNMGIGGWIIYLSLVPGLVLMPANVGAFLAGFLRDIPFVLLAQFLVLRPTRNPESTLAGAS